MFNTSNVKIFSFKKFTKQGQGFSDVIIANIVEPVQLKSSIFLLIVQLTHSQRTLTGMNTRTQTLLVCAFSKTKPTNPQNR